MMRMSHVKLLLAFCAGFCTGGFFFVATTMTMVVSRSNKEMYAAAAARSSSSIMAILAGSSSNLRPYIACDCSAKSSRGDGDQDDKDNNMDNKARGRIISSNKQDKEDKEEEREKDDGNSSSSRLRKNKDECECDCNKCALAMEEGGEDNDGDNDNNAEDDSSNNTTIEQEGRQPQSLFDALDRQPSRLFSQHINKLVHAMGTAPRGNFTNYFDVGVPIDKEYEGNEQVLVIYGSPHAMPKAQQQFNNDSLPLVPHYTTAKEATENCDTVKVIYTDPKRQHPQNHRQQGYKQCIAIVGQWEVPHVHKWQRWRTAKLEHVPSHYKKAVPSKQTTLTSNKALAAYWQALPEALEKLKPLAAKASRGSKHGQFKRGAGAGAGGSGTSSGSGGPIVVMVANFGQFHFFVNFLCTAAARKLDASRVLLFATDEETYKQALGMGVHVFYDQSIFQSMPKGAAIDYEDEQYGRIMMSKVYCVHMVNALGYDVLFQDADLVWYRDPFVYFENKKLDFDIYMQYDGQHHPERYAPLAGNTGFYYVKHSELTEYFFSVFVRMGDLVLDDKSHQAAFTVLAKEFMSLHNLRVKILGGREHNNFLSGFHLHSRPKVVKWAKTGIVVPVLFHANWLAGVDKLPAMKVTMNWFVNDTLCPSPSFSSTATHTTTYTPRCCMKSPLRIPLGANSTSGFKFTDI